MNGVIYQPSGRAFEYSPLASNIYQGGCTHLCSYCYASDILYISREDWGKNVQPKPNYLERLRKDAAKMEVNSETPRVLLCFTCDPYPAGIDTTITRETIKILHEYGLPVQILTKGGARSTRDFDLLTCRDAYAATLTFFDPEQSFYYEPGAAHPLERMEVLAEAHARGIETWASLEPVIDPNQSLRLIEYSAPYVDLFRIGKLNQQRTMPAELRKIEKSTNWKQFAGDAVDLCQKLGKAYYIKNDLRAYLEG